MGEDLDWYRPLHQLNLNRLLTFMAVVEMRSFRAAAERIRISQSALSVQIRQLEEELGVALLHRTTRSVRLTNEGVRLYVTAKRLRGEVVQVAQDLRSEAALNQGVITITVLPSLASTILPAIFRAFRSRHPGIKLHVRDTDSVRALQLVRGGDADIGILSHSEHLQELQFTPLLDDQFVVVATADDGWFDGRSRIELRELGTCNLVLNPRGVHLREILEELFRSNGLFAQPVVELTSVPALVSFVSEGFGATILPRLSLHGLNLSRCRVIELTPRSSRQIGLVSIREKSDSPAVAGFRRFLSLKLADLAAKLISPVEA